MSGLTQKRIFSRENYPIRKQEFNGSNFKIPSCVIRATIYNTNDTLGNSLENILEILSIFLILSVKKGYSKREITMAYTKEQLQAMKRADLQKMCKRIGIKANMKVR